MLTGFEEITQDLKPNEKAQSRAVWKVMNEAFQSGETVTNTEIRRRLKDQFHMKIGGPKLRKMINWMHTNGYLKNMVAFNDGYRRAKDIHELRKYEKSLKERIGSQISRLRAVESDINTYGGRDA